MFTHIIGEKYAFLGMISLLPLPEVAQVVLVVGCKSFGIKFEDVGYKGNAHLMGINVTLLKNPQTPELCGCLGL